MSEITARNNQETLIQEILRGLGRMQENVETTFRGLRPWEQFQLLELTASRAKQTQGVEANQRLQMMLYMLEQLPLKKEKARGVRILLYNSIRYLMQLSADEWRDFPLLNSISIIEELERN